MIFFDNEPYNQGYMSFGDVDFFERGRLVREDSIASCYHVIYCEPNPDQEDNFLFGLCYVDISDSWLSDRAPRLQEESGEEYAVRCVDEFGAAEFGSGWPWPVAFYSRAEVLSALRDMCVSPDYGGFPRLRATEPVEFLSVKMAVEKMLEAGSRFDEAIDSEETRSMVCQSAREAISALLGRALTPNEVPDHDCFLAVTNTWLSTSNAPLTYSSAAEALSTLSDMLVDQISRDDVEVLSEKAGMFRKQQEKADNKSALIA